MYEGTSSLLTATSETSMSSIPQYQKPVNEIYETSGSLTSTISLNNNVSHALNISKWVPTITKVETKHTSNIEYEGTIEDS